MELIGSKKFKEIAELTDEEFDLLVDNAYLIPYDVQDDKMYFFENEAEFTKSMKDQWLEEAKEIAEWAKENKELDDAIKAQIDDEWDSEILELEHERVLDDEYKDRAYGDTQKVITNEEPTEDDLKDIYSVLGLSMEPEESEADFKKQKEKEKKKLKKHRQFVTNNSIEESLDPNKGTRIYYDGSDVKNTIEQNYGSNAYSSSYTTPYRQSEQTTSYQSSSYDQSYQKDGYHIRQDGFSGSPPPPEQSASAEYTKESSYQQQQELFRKLHEQVYQQNYNPYPSGSTQINGSYQSYIGHESSSSVIQNYQSSGHQIKNIDYSRKNSYEEKMQEQADMDKKVYQPNMVNQFESKFQGENKHYQNQNNQTNNDRGRMNPSNPNIRTDRMKEIQQETRTAGSPRSEYGSSTPTVSNSPGPGPHSTSGYGNPNQNANNQSEYKMIYGSPRHDSRIRMNLGGMILHGTQIEQTDAYQGYRKMKVYGGAIVGSAVAGFSARRGAAYQLQKMQQAGITPKNIGEHLVGRHMISKSMAESFQIAPTNLRNARMIQNAMEQAMKRKYGITLSHYDDKKLKQLMAILKNGDQKTIAMYISMRGVNEANGRWVKSKKRGKNARRRLRQEILHGLDAYDAAVLLAKTFRGARSAAYVMQRSSRFVGRHALKLAKRVAPKSVGWKITKQQVKIRKKARIRNEKKLNRLKKVADIKARIKGAPRNAAGKAFKKVFKKNFSDTAVGKVTKKIGKFFDGIFGFFDNINKVLAEFKKRILIAIGGFLLIILVIQLIMSVAIGITSTVQSLFTTSKGENVSEKDVMKSAGGEILTALTDKDKSWVQNDVYQGVSSPEEVNNKKVYGGTDPKTGKKIEITEFGSSENESAGINVNFYNGNAYSAITGKIVPELLQDKKSSNTSSSKKTSETTKDDSSTSSKLKKAKSSITYKGDEVIFASKGGDNDGIKKTFVSNLRTTGYCSACNGDYKSSITPNGNAIPGFTVAVALSTQAAKGLPYGSVIYISGHYYVVQDCGPPPNTIDIYVADTLTCAGALESAVTKDNVPVYIVKGAKCDFKKLNKITLDGKDYTGVHVDDNGTKKWILFDGVVTGVNGGAVSGTSNEIATSNAKAILSMGTVYFDQGGYNDSRLLKAYCLDLWDASHKLKRSLSDIYQCGGCREVKNFKCNDEKIKNAKGPNGKSYGLLDGIKVKKDSHGDEGCKKYYCNQDKNDWQKYKYKVSGCEGTENKRGKETDATLTLDEIKKYPKSLKDEAVKDGKGKINCKQVIEISDSEKAHATADPKYKAKCKIVETYTESKCPGHYGCDGKHTKKYCPGHVDLNVDACVVGIDENEAVQLFQIDPGDTDSKVKSYSQLSKTISGEKIKWDHWTKENRDMVHIFFDDDWKKTYGIDIESLEQEVSGVPSNVVTGTLSSADTKKILDELPSNLPEKRRKLIETALSAVGKIPYHYGDKAKYPGLEKNNFGSYSYMDKKGRNRKGLDCSHFVDWTYWTAVGNNLGGGDTLTLKTKGKETSSLKPGDIMVRDYGSARHTGIFIGYSKKGQMIYVHESGSHGNVTVTTGDFFAKSKGGVNWRNMDQYLK